MGGAVRTPITPGKRLINTLSAHGLRDTLAELGVDELIPELFETEFDDEGHLVTAASRLMTNWCLTRWVS
jgi:hypothetical protein